MTDLFAPQQSTSDAELITAVRDGDDGAFAELYRRHLESAKAAARSLTRSRADADDVVAEGFTRVLQAIRNGGGPQLAFRPYLVTAVRNAYYDRMRKDRRIDSREEVPEVLDLAVLRQSDSSDDRALAARAYASLPERWQLVLWHTEVEGRTPAEVGPLLGLAPNAAAALAYRAREGLRQAYLQAHLQQPIPVECAEIRPQLGAYVRDGLSMRDRRKVDAHLETCKRCEDLVGDLQEANTTLRAALIPLLLGVPAAKYLAQLHGGTGVTAFARRQPKGVQGAAAAAAAVMVVGVGAFGVNRLNQPKVPTAVAATAPVATVRPTTARTPGTRVVTVAPGVSANPNPTAAANGALGPVTLPGPLTDSTFPLETIAAGQGNFPLLPVLPTNATTRSAATTTRPRSVTTPTRAVTTTTTTTTSTTSPPAGGQLTIPGDRTGGRSTTTVADPTTLAPPDSTTTTATVPLGPQITLSMSSSTSALPGQYIYTSLDLANAAGAGPFASPNIEPAQATASTVTIPLPPGVTFSTVDTPDWKCSTDPAQPDPAVSSILTCILPTIAP